MTAKKLSTELNLDALILKEGSHVRRQQDALAPTVATLQTSALALVERMLAEGRE